jgi:hypothetical protein
MFKYRLASSQDNDKNNKSLTPSFDINSDMKVHFYFFLVHPLGMVSFSEVIIHLSSKI